MSLNVPVVPLRKLELVFENSIRQEGSVNNYVATLILTECSMKREIYLPLRLRLKCLSESRPKKNFFQ